MRKLNLFAGAFALALGGVFSASASAEAANGFASLNGGTTGGNGGKVVSANTGSDIHQAICNRAADDTPLIIEVEGTITPGNTSKFSGSCNTADGVIELKEIQNITIIGVGSGALFDEIGVHIRNSSNIILRNLHIRDVKKSGGTTSNGGDAIGMESNVSNVWVDHVTLEAFGGENEGYDGLFDMKADTNYVTLSYSVLMNSGRGGLVGSSSGDLGNGPVTYHHNHYINIDSRVPLLRGATAHIYNNHYDGINKSGINSRKGGKAKVDNNYFEDAKNPIGTFYVNDMGYWDVSGNIFDNVTWTEEGDDNHPAGPNVQSTTSISIPYSYTLDDASCVPNMVANTAGAYTNMAVSDGSCDVTIPEPTSTPTTEPSVDPTSEPTSEPGVPSGDEVLNITASGTSSDFFDISGNLSSSKGTVNYSGLTLTEALKIESSTSITFTSSADAELVLVFNEGEDGDIKINGTSRSVSNGVLSVELSAGSHSISKDNTMNLYYISLAYEGGTEPTAEPTSAPTAEPTAAPTAEPTAAPTAEPTAAPTAQPTSEPEVPSGEVLNITESGKSSDFFNISGNLSSSKGTVNYNGLTLTEALKIESSTSITFTSSAAAELVLVFNEGEDGDIKINGTSHTVSDGVLSIELSAGSHSISKDNTMNLYYISLSSGGGVTPPVEPTAAPTGEPTAPPTSEPTPVPTLPPVSGNLSADCIALATDDSVNWYDTSLQTDQEIIECLSQSLGRAVGYGQNTLGGYNPAGDSNLVVITKNNAEDQILAAISSADHNWIVFDKDDFASETHVMMYRPYCSSSSLADDLGVSEAVCRDPYAWCDAKGESGSSCLETFFNDELNSSSLPVRNYMIDSNTTIDGRGAKATFVFNGFKIGADSSGASTYVAENVIITNNKFIGVGHTEDHSLDPDMIRSTGESHDIWIHKNTFDTTGDSAFDVKVGAYDITMSFNKLVDVKRAALHGSSDSRTINEQIRTTMHNNNFVTTDDFYDTAGNTARRVPLIRRGTSHQFNNLFMNYRKDILSIRKGASVVHEDNIFLINSIHQEKDDVNDAVDERAEELMRDYDGGNFLASGTPLYFSDSECQLDASTYRDLSVVAGTVTDVYADYNGDTKAAMDAYVLPAGQDLADYVAATAGVDGNLPYNSPLAASIDAVVAAHNGGCQ
ncbi:pectate lyase family protein [Teredinibacter franksiae]|uniref:pectate lyase family protein n=1 Tax=Teredinibacter franksiae TaxID=2761453 RepID=UPI001629E8F9|nr:PT domain-containing protein [Teredinibacter franksiae]